MIKCVQETANNRVHGEHGQWKDPDATYMLEARDIQGIAYVMYVLYQESKLSADDMRDLAHTLLAALGNAEKISV